jgi:hypothetical protein
MERKRSKRERLEIQIRTYARISCPRDMIRRWLCRCFDLRSSEAGPTVQTTGGERSERVGSDERAWGRELEEEERKITSSSF